MEPFNETWYSITNWDGSVEETTDKTEAKLALREGREVAKHTRVIFHSGPTLFRMTASTDIFKIRDL